VLAFVPTLMVVLAAAALFGVRKWKAMQAAKAIEAGLNAQSKAQVEMVRPDQQGEVEALQQEFQKAVSALKTSRLGRGGQNAMSVLPWFVIIGPPGAGKSTALRNSGLKFPYLSSRGGGVRGLGGTRNCEWWFTNEGVILDTAGRYATGDEDREEWGAFLDLVGKNRPRRPVNGVLVAVSVAEFLDKDAEASAELGQRLRERIDDMMGRLKTNAPVYLLFTKCDLLSGFVELFRDLPRTERGQLWGFTLPVTGPRQDPGETFADHFDALSAIVSARAVERMPLARRIEDREKIFHFPAAFEGLKPKLVEFVQALFAENPYQETPVIRGAYFSSGTQEGRPIDRAMSAMASAFGIQATLPEETGPAPDGKSYFLGDMFRRVIFPDKDLAVPTAREQKRQRTQQFAMAAGCVVLGAMLLSLPTVAYLNNRDLVRRVEAVIQQVKNEPIQNAASAITRLAPLRDELSSLLKSQQESPPWSMRFGMYQGDQVLEATRAFYAANVRKAFVEPLVRIGSQELRAFVDEQEGLNTELSAREHFGTFDQLKLYMLLTGPKEPSEPALTEAQRGWMLSALSQPWIERMGGASAASKALQEHLSLYVQLLGSDASLWFPREPQLVARSREVFKRMPLTGLALERIVSDISREEEDVSLASLVGAAPHLRAAQTVRAAFSKKVFETKVKERLETGVENADLWVLTADPKAIEADMAGMQLRSLYFREYISEWRRFIDGLALYFPPGSAQSLAALEDLTGGEPPPLARLFRAIAVQTRIGGKSGLEAMADGAFAAATEKLKGKFLGASAAVGVDGKGIVSASGSKDPDRPLTATDVRAAFNGFVRFGAPPPGADANAAPQPVALDSYQEQLQFLRDAMRADMESGGDHTALVARVQTARGRVRAIIDAQEVGWRPRLEALLWPPIEGASAASSSQMAAAVSEKWCSSVYSTFRQNLAKRYPFDRRGHDAALSDVIEFYKPNTGTLWAFYGQELKSDVPRSGNTFQFSKRPGAASAFRSEVLTFLSRAQDVSSALFPPNAAAATVPFDVHIQPAPKTASVSLTVDGQTYEYRNGPEEWHSFQWPGAGTTRGAVLRVRSNKGVVETLQQEGEWGLFRLFEEASVRGAGGGRVFTLVWKIPSLDTEVAIDIRPARGDSPFIGNVKPGQKGQLLQPFRTAGVIPPPDLGQGAGCPES